MRLYINAGGPGWSSSTGWAEGSDHCTWEGVTCSTKQEVTALVLDAHLLTGDYPTDLNSLPQLVTLNLSSNSLLGTIPDDLCVRSTGQQGLNIKGDAANCPNTFDTTTGTYLEGCCDTVEVSTS